MCRPTSGHSGIFADSVRLRLDARITRTCKVFRVHRHCLITEFIPVEDFPIFDNVVLGCALLRIFCEEVMVAARYPEYRQYAATTWRMVPYIF
jgi:hypothetical protein